MNPKVFVCHASEDKERFVRDFATKLHSKGIDAWVDEREMLPGDSLVDKIFEEGIKNAQAVIVVLSKYSVDKPWVREELNASMVKRINEGSKLIPVIIDDCQVPVCLQSTVWEKIENLNNYDAEFERIVMSIYGQRDKPPIGTPPSYTQTKADILPDLTEIDSLVFKLSCEKAIEIGDNIIQTEIIMEQTKSLGIHQEEFFESLEILENRGYIKATRVFGNIPISHFLITVYGFEKYAHAYIEGYNSIFQSVAFQIVNHDKKNNKSISMALNQPQMIVNHILDVLQISGKIKVTNEGGGGRNICIFSVSPELKRMLI